MGQNPLCCTQNGVISLPSCIFINEFESSYFTMYMQMECFEGSKYMKV